METKSGSFNIKEEALLPVKTGLLGRGLAASWERPGVWDVDLSVLQVYSIISVQLLITVAIIAIFTFV